ncbi:hypothetical protein BHH44_07375 [Salmonella enterica]|nr:hypothetical protein [Salmonella enterica]EDK1799053.1 hypothetical protein [Salmonella enterica subsp. enterica serovar Give]EAS2093929.1 hypothetical protein [Salmonella enterica]EAZ0462160.1 hypothetical protein [Salmonella enterica]EAZ1010279.1 hypothetical protein [Salmonella enterica]
MSTITNNKLTDERPDDEGLELLITIRREIAERHASEGRMEQCAVHTLILNALLELQERRRTDNQEPASERERIRRKTEPVAYLVCNGHLYQDRPFLDLSTARKSVKDRNDGAEIKALCVCEISAEK